MDSSDADVPSATLQLVDPRPSCNGRLIEFDVYGTLASAASSRRIEDIVAAANLGHVILFFHGGGFAAGDKKQ